MHTPPGGVNHTKGATSESFDSQGGAGGRTRTDTGDAHKILSLARLPISPHRHCHWLQHDGFSGATEECKAFT